MIQFRIYHPLPRATNDEPPSRHSSPAMSNEAPPDPAMEPRDRLDDADAVPICFDPAPFSEAEPGPSVRPVLRAFGND